MTIASYPGPIKGPLNPPKTAALLSPFTHNRVLSLNIPLFLTESNAQYVANFIFANGIKEALLSLYSNSPGIDLLINQVFERTHITIKLVNENTGEVFRHKYSTPV